MEAFSAQIDSNFNSDIIELQLQSGRIKNKTYVANNYDDIIKKHDDEMSELNTWYAIVAFLAILSLFYVEITQSEPYGQIKN